MDLLPALLFAVVRFGFGSRQCDLCDSRSPVLVFRSTPDFVLRFEYVVAIGSCWCV